MQETFFGTDGIRAKVGTDPMTPAMLMKLGKAIGAWSMTLSSHVRILLATDTRQSAAICKASLKAGLFHYPVTVEDAGIAPTPLVYHCMKDVNYTIAVIITASHNPFYDNGIKIFKAPIGKLSYDDEQTIMEHFYKEHPLISDSTGKEIAVSHLYDIYKERLEHYFPKKFLKGVTISLDCAHGALSFYAQKIFEHFGAHTKMINIHPDGKNINAACGSLYPKEIANAVIRYNALIGFSFDGDGDRVIVSTQDGVIKDGDDLLALLIKHPRYRHNQAIVGTIMSNQGLTYYLEQQGRSLIRTPVGDKYILEILKKENLTLGGEPSGHIIARDFSDCPDGIFNALRIVETAITTNDWSLTTYTKFPQVSLTIPILTKKDLNAEPIAPLIKNAEKTLNGGRLIVRYSGTEKVLRLMGEGPDEQQLHELLSSLSQSLMPYVTQK